MIGIGIVIVILVVITIDRRCPHRWLDKTGVRFLLSKFRSTVQRVLVQFRLTRNECEPQRHQQERIIVALMTMGRTDRWGRLDLLDFFGVFLVVKAVSKEIPKVTQGTLQGVRNGLFPTLEG